MADTQQRPADLATVCAELYTTLRSGFHILPPGTHVDVPTETSNYKSIDDNIDDVRAEIGRLRKLGHLISWDTAQQRHPSLRDKRRPDHVLALGAVVKSKPGGRKKTRLVIDPSRATTRASPHAEVAGLNDSIELPGCRLPTVTQASKAMTRRCWMFKADATDAFMQTKHSVDSLRLMGIVFDGALMVYNSLCFGLKSAPAHQQRLATIFSRVVMRRWKASGIDIGAVPGCDLMQAWPVSGDRKAYMFSYLDDFYGCGFLTKTEADTAYDIFLSTAEELGLELQYDDDKTVPATQKTDFLGVIFSSREMSLSLSKERIAKMVADLRDLRAADTISVADLMRLIGVLMFATVVFSLCRPYLRQMMSLLRTAGPEPAKQRRLPIPSTVVDDIHRHVVTDLHHPGAQQPVYLWSALFGPQDPGGALHRRLFRWRWLLRGRNMEDVEVAFRHAGTHRQIQRLLARRAYLHRRAGGARSTASHPGPRSAVFVFTSRRAPAGLPYRQRPTRRYAA